MTASQLRWFFAHMKDRANPQTPEDRRKAANVATGAAVAAPIAATAHSSYVGYRADAAHARIDRATKSRVESLAGDAERKAREFRNGAGAVNPRVATAQKLAVMARRGASEGERGAAKHQFLRYVAKHKLTPEMLAAKPAASVFGHVSQARRGMARTGFRAAKAHGAIDALAARSVVRVGGTLVAGAAGALAYAGYQRAKAKQAARQ